MLYLYGAMGPVCTRGITMIEVDAIILAAGLSKRMGQAKLLMPFGEATLLDHFLHKFPYHLFRTVIMVYNDNRVQEIAEKYPLELVYNPSPEQGQGSSICYGAQYSRATDGMLFTVADQPFLGVEVIQPLLEEFGRRPQSIIRSRHIGIPQNPVIFPQYCREKLQEIVGDKGGREVIRQYPEALHYVDFVNELPFKDVDCYQDYTSLLKHLAL